MSLDFALMIAGFVFLFNPVLSIYDILPDVIGWAFIYAGMSRLRDMAPSLEGCMTNLRRLIWITAAQAGVMTLLPLMTDTAYALTFTFIFTISEAAIAIMFVLGLLEGMQYIAVREEVQSPLADLSTVKSINIIFPIAKAFLTLLPELAYLSTTEYEGYITAIETFDLANYRHVLYMLNVVGVLIFGLIWLNMTLRYLNGMRRDKALIEALDRYYIENVATQTDMLFCRALRCALILFGAGFAFQLDIVLDGICFTPDFVGGVLFLLGAVTLLRRYPAMAKLRLLSIGHIALSAVGFVLLLIIGVTYWSWGITKSIAGFYTFIAFMAFAVLAAAVFVLILMFMLRFVSDLIENHTGDRLDEKFARMKERIENMREDLRRQLKWFFVTGVLSAVSSVLRYALMYAFPVFWLIDLIIQLVWIWNSIGLMMSIWQRVAEKYHIRHKKVD